MIINNIGNIRNNNIKNQQAISNNSIPFLSNRKELSELLFGKASSSKITFGWSKNVNPTEEKILNILTDPSVKSAIVGGHCRPDGDAFGSVIGLCGILNRMGVKVFPTVDDKNPTKFANMPSHNQYFSANEVIKNIKETVKALESNKIKRPDIAIITDSANPTMTTEALVKTFASAKQIIIIDHHPDQEGEPTNKEQWVNAFVKNGANPNNITYWREHRVAAAEMIGELDKEVCQEAKNGKIAQHNPEYYKNYRIAVAGGIYTDAGGVNGTKGNADKISIARLSDKKIRSESGKFESITRNTFNWLLDNSGIKKSEIDINKATSIPLPKKVDKLIEDILDGTKQISGILVKPSTEEDHVYVYLQNNWSGLNILSKMANDITGENNITPRDVYYEIKKRLEDKIVEDKNNGLTIIASNNDKENNFTLSLRSYGYEALDGETYTKGHVFTDKLATKTLEALKKAGIGEGGGHSNATGFRSTNNKEFMKDGLPLILKAYKEETEGKDLRAIPESLKAKVLALPEKCQKEIKFA